MPDTALLHAGSVGKTFFAALALQLAAEGRIGLDENVSRYLGDEPWYSSMPNARTITVRMLLNHTSGIPEYGGDFVGSLIKDPRRQRTPLDAVKSVLGSKPHFAAGSKFGYTDVNFQLLQLLAERVTGTSAYSEIERRILKPLGFRRIVAATQSTVPGLAMGYAGKDSFMGFDAVMKDGALIMDPAFEGGGGGYITNAGDLARWMAFFSEGKAFPATLLGEVRSGVDAGQLDVGKDAKSGLGVEIVQTPLGTAYGHGGFFPGYISLVLWYPERGVSVAIQINSSAGDAMARPLRDVVQEAATALTQP
jgi:D-alanyl-D-alanine carboxypeptidase